MTNIVLPVTGRKPILTYFLAAEEYLARHSEDDAFFLWRVPPTVICGRNQVIAAETDLEFCMQNGVEVFRRKSGGGAVYSDWGNLMVSCVLSSDNVQFAFDRYLQQATLYLRSLGLKAERSGRNDILVEGKKVSGNAFYRLGSRSIIHGTMLFDVDLDMMTGALSPTYSKISGKGIASVRQRVANISDFIDMDMATFRTGLVKFFCSSEKTLPESALGEIEEIMRTYTDWEFMRGHEPEHGICFKGRVEGVGELEAECLVKSGKLRKLVLRGDYFPLCEDPGAELTELLSGTEFSAEAIAYALPSGKTEEIIRGLRRKDFLGILFG